MLDWLAIVADVNFGTWAELAARAADTLANIDNPNRYEFYAVPLVVAWGLYMGWQMFEHRRSLELKGKAEEAGLSEPASLHPVIDPARCIGCGACVNACPEGKVLGLINNKAELIEAASCIGHGACKAACPTDAISLVFGTATRGVEIPQVAPNFETNVPGIFIAGELGGMGLIANAVEQGRQALLAIARLDGVGSARRHPFDVVIIGAGPAGIAASLAAREQGLRAVTLEQESFGGTVAHYPRGKVVMTRPGLLPLHGRFGFRRVRKERLLAFWLDVVKRNRLRIRYGEQAVRIRPLEGGGFEVQTAEADYQARAVLLATGRRGSPRKLGVPGEEHEKIVYSLISPEQYRGRHVLVVGGGDSALEAATALAVEGAAVTLSYRGSAFTRPKPASRRRLEAALARGRIQLMLESTVAAIHPDRVDITWGGRVLPLRNDAVIICAGGVLPGAFLKSIGIAVEMKYGAA
jgi:thioredoxin reductase/NAD-dependent dihydropyrimidine dehydrogenase PreA subunit